jgi:flagellar motor protein MotB
MRNRRSRVTSHSEIDSEGSWAISYGDMVTLLLTFFIIFFAADKFKMQKALKLDLMEKQTKQTQALADQMQKNGLFEAKFDQELKGRVFQVGQRVIVEFSGVSFFQSGETDLNSKAKKALSEFYRVYSPHLGQFSLGIRAYTDPRKVIQKERRFKDNLELSALRSISVMRHFQNLGVPLENMRLSGYGELILKAKDLEFLPAAERKPSAVYDLARTVTIVIEPKGDL